MALFDRLVVDDEVPKVVDIGHQAFDRFFTVAADIEFAAEARRRGDRADGAVRRRPDDRARQGYAMLQRRFPGPRAGAGVQRGGSRKGRDYRDNFPPARRGGDPVQHSGAAPGAALGDRSAGLLVRRYACQDHRPHAELYGWMRRVFEEFRELEVRLLLGEWRAELIAAAEPSSASPRTSRETEADVSAPQTRSACAPARRACAACRRRRAPAGR